MIPPISMLIAGGLAEPQFSSYNSFAGLICASLLAPWDSLWNITCQVINISNTHGMRHRLPRYSLIGQYSKLKAVSRIVYVSRNWELKVHTTILRYNLPLRTYSPSLSLSTVFGPKSCVTTP